jgi:hypothetical protein
VLVRLPSQTRTSPVRASSTIDALPVPLGFRFDGPLSNVFVHTPELYNGMIDKRPLLIARCIGVADVIAAVN